MRTGDVTDDDARVLDQTGGVDGLWSRDTPLGETGYYGELSFDGIVVSHHVLTTDGIISGTGNRTPGICVTGRDVTNYTMPEGTNQLTKQLALKMKRLPRAGLEPATPRLEVWCASHCANEAL